MLRRKSLFWVPAASVVCVPKVPDGGKVVASGESKHWVSTQHWLIFSWVLPRFLCLVRVQTGSKSVDMYHLLFM